MYTNFESFVESTINLKIPSMDQLYVKQNSCFTGEADKLS